jgi:Tat protein secretion system quality control protein TatD with DNase activity
MNENLPNLDMQLTSVEEGLMPSQQDVSKLKAMLNKGGVQTSTLPNLDTQLESLDDKLTPVDTNVQNQSLLDQFFIAGQRPSTRMLTGAKLKEPEGFVEGAVQGAGTFLQDPASLILPVGGAGGVVRTFLQNLAPTLGAGAGSGAAAQVAKEEGAGTLGQVGAGLVGGVAGALAPSAISQAMKAATEGTKQAGKYLFETLGKGDTAKLKEGLMDGGIGIKQVDEMIRFAKEKNIEIPPSVLMAQTAAGQKKLSDLYKTDPRFIEMVDQQVERFGRELKQVIGKDVGSQGSLRKVMSMFDAPIDDPTAGKRTAEQLATQWRRGITKDVDTRVMQLEDAQKQFLANASDAPADMVVKGYRALEAKRLTEVHTKKNQLYSEFKKLADEGGAKAQPNLDEAMALRSAVAKLNADDAFAVDPVLKQSALRILGGKVDEAKSGLILPQSLTNAKESGITLQELHTFRKRLNKEFKKDEYTFGQMLKYVDETIDRIGARTPEGKRAVDAMRGADDYFRQNVGIPANLDSFNALAANKKRAVSANLISDKQSVEEFLSVHNYSKEAEDVVAQAAKYTLVDKVTDPTTGLIDSTKLAKLANDKDAMDVFNSLPVTVRKQVDGLLANADDLVGQHAALKAQQTKLNEDLANSLFTKIVGEGGLDKYVDDLIRVKDNQNLFISEIAAWKKSKGVPLEARDAVEDTVKMRLLDRAIEGAKREGISPTDWMMKGDKSGLYQSTFGSDFAQVKDVLKLTEMFGRFKAVKDTQTKVASDTGNLEIAGTGQSIQSVISLIFNPIMSARYAAATVAGRTLKYQLTQAEKMAAYDMYTHPEQFKKLLQYGRSHNWNQFEKELVKIYDSQMALRAAYRGTLATGQQTEQPVE